MFWKLFESGLTKTGQINHKCANSDHVGQPATYRCYTKNTLTVENKTNYSSNKNTNHALKKNTNISWYTKII